MARLAITCTIIAQNERDRIGLTIESVRDLVAEVLVIDSGSTDGTQDYCRSLGARVIENPWPGFGPQKRFAEENATHDWILNLDADEWLSEELRGELRALIEAGEPAQKTWRMKMTIVYPHRERPCPFADFHDYVRLYDRRAARFPMSLVHDEVKPLPGSPRFKGPAYHKSFRSFDHLVRKELDYYRQQKKEVKKGRAQIALRLPFEFPWQFLKYYFARRHVFGGFYGWQLAVVLAFMRWLRLAILANR